MSGLAVSSVSIGADARYSLALSQVEYIELATSAYMDASGRMRYVTDAALIVDAARITHSKPFAEAVSVADYDTEVVQKFLGDSIGLSETVSTLRVFVRSFADSFTLPEFIGKAFTPAPFHEVAPALDAYRYTLTRTLSDAVAIDDGTSVGDGSTYFFQKYLNNVVFSNDAVVLRSFKAASEQISLSEAGVVSMQNYCDITYFAGDYVGISSSF